MCSVSVYKEPESTKGRARVMGKSKVGKVNLTKPSYSQKLKIEIVSPLKLLTHLKQCHHQKFFFKFSWDNYLVSRKVSVFYHIFSVVKKVACWKLRAVTFCFFWGETGLYRGTLFLFLKNLYSVHWKHVNFLAFAGITVVERCLLKCVCWYSWERVRIDGAY